MDPDDIIPNATIEMKERNEQNANKVSRKTYHENEGYLILAGTRCSSVLSMAAIPVRRRKMKTKRT